MPLSLWSKHGRLGIRTENRRFIRLAHSISRWVILFTYWIIIVENFRVLNKIWEYIHIINFWISGDTISGDQQIFRKTRFHYTILHYTMPYTRLYVRQASVIGILPHHTTLRGGWCRSIPYPVVTHTRIRWHHGISKAARGSEPNGTSCHKTFVHKATRQR